MTWSSGQPVDTRLAELLESLAYDDPWYARLFEIQKLIGTERLEHAGQLAAAERDRSPMDADEASPPAPSDESPPVPRFDLNGDARLQFWRETYLTALTPLVAVLAPGAVDSFQLAAVSRSACALADLALAQHLARNDRERLDRAIFETLLVAAPELGGPK